MGLTSSRQQKYCDPNQGSYYASELELLSGFYEMQVDTIVSRKNAKHKVTRRQHALYAHILSRAIDGLKSGRLCMHVCDYHLADMVASHAKVPLHVMLETLANEIRYQSNTFKNVKFQIKPTYNNVYLKFYI